jgi:hypothetical protein
MAALVARHVSIMTEPANLPSDLPGTLLSDDAILFRGVDNASEGRI